MDEEPTSNVEEHMEGESDITSKRVRHRKKQLYKDIRKQMEFYFSDANLTKDRFLGELVLQDPRDGLIIGQSCLAFGAMGCHLSTQMAPEKLCSIATFEPEDKKNEDVPDGIIKKETNENEVNQSLESPSKKKKKKKKVKLELPEETITEDSKNTDSVEEPEIISSAKIRKRKKTQDEAEESETESGHGQSEINEDTPPKRKKKRKSGSTEFEVKEELQETNAEEAISSSHSTVTESQLEKKIKKKKREDTEEKSNNSNDEAVDGIESLSKKKRKREPDNTEETDECKVTSSDDIKKHSIKKKKNEDGTEENQPIDVDSGEVQNSEKETELEVATEAVGEEMVEGSSKKKRKRKKKHKKEKQDTEASRLQVLSKKEWKRLRNKYLDLQKTKMKALKQYLNNKWNRNAGGYRNQHSNGYSQEKEEHNEDSTEVAAVKQENVSKPKISFTPGVIVHAIFDEPILDLRKFKADTKTLSDVQYIDVVMGANEAFIRCASSTAAENLVTNSPWQHKEVLKGEVEKNYWEKIFKDREVKFSKNIRVKQRGRDKILRRAERELGKHIKFDD
ncbi:hypothetical protein C0J52_13849 [Blattella germanica]|nr:hypothetical protein C0J52_13849 [Blattella germanica]